MKMSDYHVPEFENLMVMIVRLKQAETEQKITLH
jgi:hypothetical protein